MSAIHDLPACVVESGVLVGGFHLPLKQEVLRSLLRRDRRAARMLARGMSPQPAFP